MLNNLEPPPLRRRSGSTQPLSIMFGHFPVTSGQFEVTLCIFPASSGDFGSTFSHFRSIIGHFRWIFGIFLSIFSHFRSILCHFCFNPSPILPNKCVKKTNFSSFSALFIFCIWPWFICLEKSTRWACPVKLQFFVHVTFQDHCGWNWKKYYPVLTRSGTHLSSKFGE